MDYLALREEILSGPKAAHCAAHVVTNDMPKDPDYRAKDQAIADLISAGRTKIAPRLVGTGEVELTLGIPAGPVFIYGLEVAGATPPGEGATTDQIAAFATARSALRALNAGAFQIGSEAVRAGIDLFVGTLLTVEQAATIKAMAETPDPITAADVSRALRGPWE